MEAHVVLGAAVAEEEGGLRGRQGAEGGLLIQALPAVEEEADAAAVDRADDVVPDVACLRSEEVVSVSCVRAADVH